MIYSISQILKSGQRLIRIFVPIWIGLFWVWVLISKMILEKKRLQIINESHQRFSTRKVVRWRTFWVKFNAQWRIPSNMLRTGHLLPMTYIRDKLNNCNPRVCYLYFSRFETVSNKVIFYFEIFSLLSLVSVDVVQVDLHSNHNSSHWWW